MRLQTLELIRYGKFAGEKLDLPRAGHDFHFIVGPNEAGKSTIRSAISDLLFGMPLRSALGFRHPLSDLRLGAVAQHEQGVLSFERAKANKNTLRDRSDQVLPDATLEALLGNVERSFFEQMFALDHQSLVRGGHDILNASSNLGQILFQSAAGIDSLGRIHEALAAEADEIWTPRKAANRKYYAAADQFEQAKAELKDATVRPKEWTDADQGLQDALQKLEQEKQRHATLETTRNRLERIRRTGPDLAELQTTEEQLRELDGIIAFPADAAARLASARASLDSATPRLQFREEDVERLQAALQQVIVNDKVLASASEIQELDSCAKRFGDHHRDIPVRQKEVKNLLAEASALAAEIGWQGDGHARAQQACDEQALRAMLPGKLGLGRVTDLAKENGVITAAEETARRSADRKSLELEALQASLAAVNSVELSPGLETALQEAQEWRKLDARLRAHANAMADTSGELQTRLAALGTWTRAIETLRAMPMPATDRVAQLRNQRQAATLELRAARKQLAEASAQADATQLGISQFKEARHLVTTDQVNAARKQRDSAWQQLKSGEVTLQAGAPAVEQGIQQSDELADSQLSSVSDSTELQSLQHQLQRELQDVQQLQRAAQDRDTELARLDQDWASQCEQIGLAGMAIDDFPAWSACRDAALAAATELARRQAEHANEQHAATTAFDALRAELAASGAPAAIDRPAAELLADAARHVSAARAANVKHQSFTEQLTRGRAELAALQREASDRRAELDDWHRQWQQALAAVRLERFQQSIKTAEDAVALVGQLQAKLDKVMAIRKERIEPMQADLERFASNANALARELDPALLQLDPAAIAKALGTRLAAEQAARKEADRLRAELSTAQKQRKEAEEHVASARLSLAPLLEAGRVDDIAALEPLIQQSDRKRELQRTVAAIKSKLIANGDGLSLAAIASEVQAQDLSLVPGQLQSVIDESRASTELQADLNGKCLVARQALERIAGGDDAATAEARRQEALSGMAQACERYIKVATAGRLLKWAIDRYRDRKQGPLLARAGEIFSGLTLGGFRKLTVDFDAKPVTLAAVRDNGEQVGIAGMSDGTRDQLFLALRLAALELHMAQGKPMPFIADDLFINFDDARATAGLRALAELSGKTQVIFLSHHDHMLGMVTEVFGAGVNVVRVGGGEVEGVRVA